MVNPRYFTADLVGICICELVPGLMVLMAKVFMAFLLEMAKNRAGFLNRIDSHLAGFAFKLQAS